MSANIITLGREGIISDPAKKVDWLMCCFFFSKHNQSTLSNGRVISLGKIIQMTTDQPLDLKNMLSSQLTTFLERFFTRTQVTVEVEKIMEGNQETGGLGISLNIVVSDSDSIDSSAISAGYSLTYESTILREILETYSGRNLLNTNAFNWS